MEPPSSDADGLEWSGDLADSAESAFASGSGCNTGRFYSFCGRDDAQRYPNPPNLPKASASSSADAPANGSGSSKAERYGRIFAEGTAHRVSNSDTDEQTSGNEMQPHTPPTAATSSKAFSLKMLRRDRGGGPGERGGDGEFVCNECGLEFTSLQELQLHMVRKTAWSNQGLVGCRVSCLVESREWHEGLVTQYHKSGKHCIEYRRSGEKRWVNMLKTAFYIVERGQLSGGEVKEVEPDPTEGLAPIEKWAFQEDITAEFCVALSLLHRSYGCRLQETGHKTVGHTCVTDQDKVAARQVKGSLLYGELLPRGVNKAMGAKHLNAAKASTVFDLGMGTGKVAMQVFLQFPNVTRVYGVELSRARYALGEAALLSLMDLQPGVYRIKRRVTGQFMSIETVARPPEPSLEEGYEGGALGGLAAVGGGRGSEKDLCRGAAGRTLEFACGNLFDVTDIAQADLVLLETDVSSDVHPQLSRFLMGMKKGSQALTYLDLRKMWGNLPFPYRQVEINRTLSDRFPTSWSVNRGHHFFLWTKMMPSLEVSSTYGDDEVSPSSTLEHKRDNKGLSGAGRLKVAFTRADSARSTSSRTGGETLAVATGGHEEARGRIRRGHPKVSAQALEQAAPVSATASAGSPRNTSLHELFLLDANGGGRTASFNTDDGNGNAVSCEGSGAAAEKDLASPGDAGVAPPPLPPRPSAAKAALR